MSRDNDFQSTFYHISVVPTVTYGDSRYRLRWLIWRGFSCPARIFYQRHWASFNLHNSKWYLIKLLIIWSAAKSFYDIVKVFVFVPVFMWELVCLSELFGGSHPWFQLSFHSDTGGIEQFEPLKCKFPVQSVKVDKKDHNWGSMC